MVAATCISRRSSGSASSHSAMCSARSRTSACASVSPSSAGVSETATAPGPKASSTRPKLRELGCARGEPFDIGLVELDDLGDQQDLPRDAVTLQRGLHALIDDALVRGVLIDDHDAVARLRHDVSLVQLRARSAERAVDEIGRGFGDDRASAAGAPVSNAACAASAKPASAVAPCVGNAGEARQSHRRAGGQDSAGTPQWSPRRRSSRCAVRHAPAPPAARARSRRAPTLSRGSAPRSWPGARSRRPRAARP